MMKIKKLPMLLLVGTLTCTAPAAVYAADLSAVEDIISENQIDSLLSDPDKAVDLIMYAKDLIDQQEISDDQIMSVIDQAADHFGISLTDEEKDSLVNIINKVKNMDIDEEQLKKTVTDVYDTLKDLGVEGEDVKGFLEKAVDFIKSLF